MNLYVSFLSLGITAFILGMICGIVAQIAISEILDEFEREDKTNEAHLHIVKDN